MAQIPDMPRGQRCQHPYCTDRATGHRLTNELVLTPRGMFEGVEFVCDRHQETGPR